MTPDVVAKVGGSLYDLPDLGPRLRSWLDTLGSHRVLLVPGGGAAADVVRDLDRVHGLGEERAHWLALASLQVTGRFLAAIVPQARFTTLNEAPAVWREGCVAVLDALGFAEADEGQAGCLPHTWDATSDAVAARVAVASGARRLVMLKSTPLPAGIDWTEAARRGLVDPLWPTIVGSLPGLEVAWVDLRDLP